MNCEVVHYLPDDKDSLVTTYCGTDWTHGSDRLDSVTCLDCLRKKAKIEYTSKMIFKRKADELTKATNNCEELEAENAELRSGLVFYAVENAKLAGTMRDADDAHGEVPQAYLGNPQCLCIVLPPDHEDDPDCQCSRCTPNCGFCNCKMQLVRPGKWQCVCPDCVINRE